MNKFKEFWKDNDKKVHMKEDENYLEDVYDDDDSTPSEKDKLRDQQSKNKTAEPENESEDERHIREGTWNPKPVTDEDFKDE